MEFTAYAFLAAFLLPVGVLGAINLLLWFGGESGTLLLPSLRRYPKVEMEWAAEPVAAEEVEAANAEVELREAA